MKCDAFKSYILTDCGSVLSGISYRPQLRGVHNDEVYLLDDRGKVDTFYDTHFSSLLDLTSAWIELHPEHRASIAQKAWLVSALLSTFSHPDVVELLPTLDIPQQESVFKAYRDVGNRLTKEFLIFAHEKSFSLKHCQSFALMPSDVLDTLLGFKDRLNLSASHFLELSELLADYARKTNLSVKDILNKEALKSIMDDDSLTQHHRTEKLKHELKTLRLPILSELNTSMASLVSSMNLPQHVNVTWDTTLENPGIDLNVKLTSKEELNTFINSLNAPNAVSGISDLLELQ